MIIYNTTFHIESDCTNECIEYFKNTYMPEVAACKKLHKGSLRRILTNNNEEGTSIAIQFYVENIETLNNWFHQEGLQIQKRLTDKFGTKISGFTTLLEEINWE